MINHIEQESRQAALEALYEADGRHDPAHPHHATYTGLVAGFTTTTEQETTDESDE